MSEDLRGTGQLRLPDFIIGGAPRSGTTWLYQLLERHPIVTMAKPARPEPKFFLIDDLFARGLEFYSTTWFADIPHSRLAGEKSTNYLESASAAKRLRASLPDVKLIFMLREPARRAWSNYLWSSNNGFEDESFESALVLEKEREAQCPPELQYVRPHAYVSRGMYAELLAPYLENFDRDQILCMRFEDVMTAPLEVARRVHEFLCLTVRPNDVAGLGAVNRSIGPEPPEKTLKKLRQRFEAPNRKLADLLSNSFTIWSDS